jgi:predicted nucleic acid-binding protein
MLRELERELDCVATDDRVWAAAFELASASRSGGITVPATYLLIAACARVHRPELLHRDMHFDRISDVARSPSS